MIANIIGYDVERDINSKEKIPVVMFAEEVAHVELGLYIKWALCYKNKGVPVPPIGGYINKRIAELTGSSFKTKEDMLKHLKGFETAYKITIDDYIVKILSEDIKAHKNDS